MFAASKTDSVSGAAPDGQFNYVTMLLHGDGTNGAQNNTFLDSSTNNFTITRNGNTTQGSFSPYGSNWSNYFDGSGDFLLFADNAGLEIGTNSFTFEAWINLTAYSSSYGSPKQYVATVGAKEGTNGSVSYRLVVNGTSNSYTELICQIYSSDSTFVSTTASYSFALNTWYHVAAVRNGTTVTLYVNGTSIGSGTDATNSQNTSAPFRVGSIGYTNFEYYFPGYISNLRLVNGTAVYTSNFTPSTTPLTAITNTAILTCQSNRFVDNSTNNAAVTINGNTSVQRFNPFGTSTAYSTSVIGGSGYFDGSGDSLSLATATALGTGNVTVEFWFYPTDISATYRDLYEGRSSVNSNTGFAIFQYGQTIEIYGNGLKVSSAASAFPANSWTHFAVVRTSGTCQIYINGVASGSSGSYSDNFTSTVRKIGDAINSFPYIGYISNLREVTSAVYSATFTPPTAPVTAISGTSLLTNFTNGAIFDNAMINNLETVGNAQISTSVVKYGTGSLAFDGSGDNLNTPASPNLAFGRGDFTIECWVYANDVTSLAGIYDGRGGSATPTIVIQSGTFKYFTNGGFQITSSSISTSTWYHLAVSRSGTSTKLFVNGVQGGSTYTDSTNYVSTTPSFIGALYDGSSLNGYIDDLRITKGFARYTSNFTAPTAAFSDTGPY